MGRQGEAARARYPLELSLVVPVFNEEQAHRPLCWMRVVAHGRRLSPTPSRSWSSTTAARNGKTGRRASWGRICRGAFAPALRITTFAGNAGPIRRHGLRLPPGPGPPRRGPRWRRPVRFPRDIPGSRRCSTSTMWCAASGDQRRDSLARRLGLQVSRTSRAAW